MAVTQLISALSNPGHRGVDTQDAFVTKQEAFQDDLHDTFVGELNTAIEQINSTETNINNKEQLANDYANKIGATVETGAYSAKEFAVGDLTVTGGSAKAWASDPASPDGTTSKSAKSYANDAMSSASAAQLAQAAAQLAQEEAQLAQAAAEAALDNFDDRYLGAKTSDPTVDNDGNPLVSGAMYWNSALDVMKVYDLTLGHWISLSFIPTDHGVLSGLGDDDHTQYHNDARGDARYYTKTQIDTNKQDKLISGTNIKKLNGMDITGEGNLTIGSVGSGGTTSTVPLTLTSSSAAQQSLTAPAWNQAVTLPDATTLSLGVNVFGLYNNSRYPIQIKDAGGNLLGFISPFKQVTCSLADKTNANGTWNLDGEALVSEIGSGDIAFSYAAYSGCSLTKSILVSQDKYLILVQIYSGYLEAVVYDSANGVFGNSAIVRAGGTGTFANAIKVSNDVALVVSCAASSDAFQGVVVSVTGTTISVGTAASLTLGGGIATTPDGTENIKIAQVGTSYIASWVRADVTAGIVAITVSGTTVTIGSVLTQSGTAVTPIVYDMGSNVAMVLSQTANSTIYASPVIVSGTTLTNGTSADITSAVTGFACKKLDSGRIALVYRTSTVVRGGIVSLSGTTAYATYSDLTSKVGLSIASLNIAKVGNQVIVALASGTNSAMINVLTDNSGTAVAGTDYGANINYVGTNGFYYVGRNSNSLYLLLNRTNDTDLIVLKIGISGNNPSVSTLGIFKNGDNINFPYNFPIDVYGLADGERSARRYVSGTKFLTFTCQNRVTGTFGIKNDAIITFNTPMYYASTSSAGRNSNPSDDTLVMVFPSSTSNRLQIQLIKAV